MWEFTSGRDVSNGNYNCAIVQQPFPESCAVVISVLFPSYFNAFGLAEAMARATSKMSTSISDGGGGGGGGKLSLGCIRGLGGGYPLLKSESPRPA